ARRISVRPPGVCAGGNDSLALTVGRGNMLHSTSEFQMTTPTWRVSGQYYETCSCDFICLCFPGRLSVTPSKGTCTAAMAFQVERGSFGQVPLDDLGFILVTLAPEAMVRGNWMVGIVVDERAT